MNIMASILDNAKRYPERQAVVFPIPAKGLQPFVHQHVTYQQFVDHAAVLASNLQQIGVKKGSKVLLFVKPCLEFPILVFALFSSGAIPVMIDPGIGLKNLLKAIKTVGPDVLVGEPRVHLLKALLRSSFREVRIAISTRRMTWLGVKYNFKGLFARVAGKPKPRLSLASLVATDTAAIVYTSGATGAPKGVVYTHAMLYAQLALLHRLMPNELAIDLSCFPLFALFTLGMGKTSVIPVMDVTKPAQVEPRNLVQHINDHGISMATGSPAIWMRLADYCLEHHLTLESLRGVIMFGAPVPVWLHEKLKIVMPRGETFTPYGATESLPVTWVTGSEILAKYKDKIVAGKGMCVGQPVSDTQVVILKNYEQQSITQKTAMVVAATHEIGEIAVKGKQVTQQYFANPSANLAAKITDVDAQWHRMGDLGYFDEQGALWFVGRNRHRVLSDGQRCYPIMVEAIFNQHSIVRRSALIQLPGKAAIVIERQDRKTQLTVAERAELVSELKELAKYHPMSKDIKDFFLHADFPVDCRHNIKIDRLRLAHEFKQRTHTAL